MGDPKYSRKVWRKPKRPLNYELKMDELKIMGTFGLRTKRELWKAHTQLSQVRHQARSLLALRQEVRSEKEPILMKSLAKIGLVNDDATLDDVLSLNANDLLSRRLQTIVTKKFKFKTPYQARQAVIHGHIMIGDRRVNIPSYAVTVNEEESIHFSPESTIPGLLSEKKGKESAAADVAVDAAVDTEATTTTTTTIAKSDENPTQMTKDENNENNVQRPDDTQDAQSSSTK